MGRSVRIHGILTLIKYECSQDRPVPPEIILYSVCSVLWSHGIWFMLWSMRQLHDYDGGGVRGSWTYSPVYMLLATLE